MCFDLEVRFARPRSAHAGSSSSKVLSSIVVPQVAELRHANQMEVRSLWAKSSSLAL